MARAATAIAAVLLLVLLCIAGASARGGGKYDGGGKRSKGSKHSRRGVCKGSSCKAMSDLLPSLVFAEGEGPVECSCEEYDAGTCFAPGCFPCKKECFDVPDGKRLSKMGGPFGTGLLCSSDCLPCCQSPDDKDLFEGSTCALPEGGCGSS
jgi:hypothetical protein